MSDLAFELRVALVFLIGLVLGGQVNRGIYRLAWSPRDMGPWSPAHPEAPPRHWSDRIPVWGWFGLEREAAWHGDWYWLRPMLIELLCGVGLAALYVWEVDGGLMPHADLDQQTIHWQFVIHTVLFALLAVATFIDFDEKTIPDEVTVTGTLFALLTSALLPQAALPNLDGSPLRLAQPWPAWLDGPSGLVLGLAILAAWAYALCPRLVWLRHGVVKAVQYHVAILWRRKTTWKLAGMAVVVAMGVALGWQRGGDYWQALLSSLVGLAFGGAVIWGIRIVASLALGVEAMGFGDVTLLGMIGAFLGWQPALIVFLLSPFAGALIAVANWAIFRHREIAFGPFLCAAAVVVVVGWPNIWARWGFAFELFGWGIPLGCVVCLVPMALMLYAWQRITGR